MYEEDDLLPISALQHLAFCERQWGLMYLENIWAENRLTAEGGLLHQQAHESKSETRGNIRIARNLFLRSLKYGLIGKADVVEFHLLSDLSINSNMENGKKQGVHIEDVDGIWSPVPVEYKRGKPKPDICDEVQLCAQAICLEEMMSVEIPRGFLFYGEPRRRHEVIFSYELRRETIRLANRLHELYKIGVTPQANFEKKCNSCSINTFCLPKSAAKHKSAIKYLDDGFKDNKNEKGIGQL